MTFESSREWFLATEPRMSLTTFQVAHSMSRRMIFKFSRDLLRDLTPNQTDIREGIVMEIFENR